MKCKFPGCFLFVEILKHSRGRYTDDQVQRAGKMAGPLTRELDKVFAHNIGECHTQTSSRKDPDYTQDIQKFIATYRKKKLFDYIPGREHSAFPKFKFQPTIDNPKKLKAKIKEIMKNMDSARNVQLRQF